MENEPTELVVIHSEVLNIEKKEKEVIFRIAARVSMKGYTCCTKAESTVLDLFLT
jgi:hypothetical protein